MHTLTSTSTFSEFLVEDGEPASRDPDARSRPASRANHRVCFASPSSSLAVDTPSRQEDQRRAPDRTCHLVARRDEPRRAWPSDRARGAATAGVRTARAPSRIRLSNGRNLMSPRISRTLSVSRARLTRVRARVSIWLERSMPTRGTPALPSGNEMRPVPQPSSRTGPPQCSARFRQKGTSRLPSVRAFSQS